MVYGAWLAAVAKISSIRKLCTLDGVHLAGDLRCKLVSRVYGANESKFETYVCVQHLINRFGYFF